jgi:hypothetical protein
VITQYGPEGHRHHLEWHSLERIVVAYDQLMLAVSGGNVSQPATSNY